MEIIHCGMQGYKKLCQTDQLLSFLAFQETFWNKKAWNCVPLHKVFRKNSHAPILDTTCTFACKFKDIPNHPNSANMEYRALTCLKTGLHCPDKAKVAWSLARLYWHKMDEVSETKSQYAHRRHITMMSFVPILCSVDQALVLQYWVCLPTWPLQSQILPKQQLWCFSAFKCHQIKEN